MKTAFTAMHAVGLLLVTAGAAAAQESFTDLQSKVRTGDQVSVTDDSGNQIRGTVEHIGSTIRLSIGGVAREWTPQQVREVRRRGDSVKNGLKIGILSGAAAGAVLGLGVASLVQNEGGDGGAAFAGLTFLGIGMGAGVGVGLDAAIIGSTVVYRRPARTVSVGPLLSPGAQGIRVAMRF